MSDDALATLLWQGYTAADCWRDMGPQGGSTLAPEKLSAWLRARGVVVLPPDHLLRTLDAKIDVLLDDLRSANEATIAPTYAGFLIESLKRLRAALAVLREPLDKQG